MFWTHLVYYLLLIVVLLGGLFINILGLPGLWIMLLGVIVYTWATGFGGEVGWATLWVLFGIAALAEFVEMFLGSAGAKKAGGSRRAMMGAVIGALVGGIFLTGLIPIPIVGTIIGVCLGAFLGAGIVELMVRGGDIEGSLRVGTGAAKGRFLGLLSKLAFGALMLLIALVAAFPSRSSTATATTAPAPLTNIAPASQAVPVPSSAPATPTGG